MSFLRPHHRESLAPQAGGSSCDGGAEPQTHLSDEAGKMISVLSAICGCLRRIELLGDPSELASMGWESRAWDRWHAPGDWRGL